MFSNPISVESDEDSPSSDDLTIKIEICDAIGLSPTLAHFVECQYTFPGTVERVLVPPTIDESLSPKTDRDRLDVRYNHSKTMTIEIEPDTLDQFERGALQIELMGHQEKVLILKSLKETYKLEIKIEAPIVPLKNSSQIYFMFNNFKFRKCRI